MTKLSSYVEFRCRPSGEPGSLGASMFVMGRLIEAVHAVNSRRMSEGSDAVLAVGLPHLAELGEDDATTPGDILRVFGAEDDLRNLLATPHLTALRSGGAFLGIPEIKDVPTDCEYMTYHRVRAPEKKGLSYVVRSERRLRKRIAEGKSQMTEEALARRWDKASANPSKKMPPFVSIRSRSTSSGFRLFMAKAPADGPGSGTFSSYGLAVDHSAVPHFA